LAAARVAMTRGDGWSEARRFETPRPNA